jgi:response regulator of citrate/malate metabolism
MVDGEKMRVLIVEDDLLWEPIWKRILKQVHPNAVYEWATSVKEAVGLLDQMHRKSEMFDLIVSDIFVSGSLTGLDLLAKYGERIKYRMLFVSGVDKKSLKEHLGTQDNFVLLQKPFTDRDCVSAIKALLARKNQPSKKRFLTTELET